MSLKGFHIFFISLASLMCFGFAAWLYAGSPFAALASVGLGIGLIVYGVSFWKKMRKLAPMQAAMVVGLGVLAVAERAWACAVCFGDPSSAQVKGLNWAIWALLGVLLIPLSGIAGFMVYLSNGAKGTRK